MFQTPFAGRPWIILLGQKTQNCSWDLTQRCRLYQKHGLVTKSEAQLSLFLLYFSQISYLNDPKENPVLTSTQANKPGQAKVRNCVILGSLINRPYILGSFFFFFFALLHLLLYKSHSSKLAGEMWWLYTHTKFWGNRKHLNFKTLFSVWPKGWNRNEGKWAPQTKFLWFSQKTMMTKGISHEIGSKTVR